MGKYCDSAALERNWYLWAIATSTPLLNEFRTTRQLYSRPHRRVVAGSRIFYDAFSFGYDHVICTSNGLIGLSSFDGNINIGNIPEAEYNIQHDYDNYLVKCGFTLDIDSETSWDLISSDVYNICSGVMSKFNLHVNDREDIVGDVYLKVLDRIKRKKFRYTPGLAPVFSLLTTAIYRSACTLLSKEKNNLKRHGNYTDDMKYKQCKMFMNGRSLLSSGCSSAM